MTPPKSMGDVAAAYGKLLVEARRSVGRSCRSPRPVLPRLKLRRRSLQRCPIGTGKNCGRRLSGRRPGVVAARGRANACSIVRPRNELTKLQNKIEALRANSPAAPPRGMVLNDSPTPVEPVVFIRGNPGRPGKQVSRHFLQAVGDFGARRVFKKGSGRLELAQDIASPQNPLTARVIVNRVWMHHFGAGIVRTASDFGIRGTPPSHPELLDYLASHFMQEGWSLKKLHRQILLSAVYQQASVLRPDQEEKDPENKLLWRMNPTRLEFEPMRDSWLAVAGDLDLTIGGRGFDIQSRRAQGRRSVYAFIDRQDLPQLFRTFDFASPDVSTAATAADDHSAAGPVCDEFAVPAWRRPGPWPAQTRTKDPAERVETSIAAFTPAIPPPTNCNRRSPTSTSSDQRRAGRRCREHVALRIWHARSRCQARERVPSLSAVRRSALGRSEASRSAARLGASHRDGRPSRARTQSTAPFAAGFRRLPATSRFTARSGIPPNKGTAFVAGSFPAGRAPQDNGP